MIEESRTRRANHGYGTGDEEKLPKPWRRASKGWINKTTPDKPGDEILSPKSGPQAYIRRRVEGRPSKKSGAWRRVESYFPAGFPHTCRSTSCALKSEVSDRRRVGWKKSQTARRSDGGEFWKENIVTGRKHYHRKKIRFSHLALIPCEERKGRIPNFYYIPEKKLTAIIHIGLIYICSWVPQYSKKIKGKDCTIFNSL